MELLTRSHTSREERGMPAIDHLDEGWALAFDGKWHYFPENDSMSLCRKIGFNFAPREEGNNDSPNNCKSCRRKLLKLNAKKSEEVCNDLAEAHIKEQEALEQSQ